jgi:hypothetical protein
LISGAVFILKRNNNESNSPLDGFISGLDATWSRYQETFLILAFRFTTTPAIFNFLL